jgi:transcriptional regulator with XRE-family HTH domain
MTDPQTVATRIRDKRMDLGMTQRALAALIGHRQQKLCRWERGLSRIPADAIPQIATALGMTVAQLFEETPT